jgi:hypothetical protein
VDFLPLQMRLTFNHQEATQCILMHEQEARPQWTMGRQRLMVA